MANSKQADKRARQSRSRRAHLVSVRSALRTSVKKLLASCAAQAAQTELQAQHAHVSTLLDRAASRNIVHRNKAARIKSRLAARIKALSGS